MIKPVYKEVISHSTMAVTLEGAKNHLRLIDTDEEDLIIQYIHSATELLERWLGYNLLSSTSYSFYNYADSETYAITDRPFKSISKIEVLQDDVWVELATTDYDIYRRRTPFFAFTGVPVVDDTDSNIRVTVESGAANITRTITGATQGALTEEGLKSVTITFAESGKAPVYFPMLVTGTGDEVLDGKSFNIYSPTNFTADIHYDGDDIGAVNSGTVTYESYPDVLVLSMYEVIARFFVNRGDYKDKAGDVPPIVKNLANPFRRYVVR